MNCYIICMLGQAKASRLIDIEGYRHIYTTVVSIFSMVLYVCSVLIQYSLSPL